MTTDMHFLMNDMYVCTHIRCSSSLLKENAKGRAQCVVVLNYFMQQVFKMSILELQHLT